LSKINDRLCGLAVRVLGYRSGGPGSILGTTIFSENKKENSSGSGTGFTQPREYKLRKYLEENVAAPVWKTEITAVADPPR
jgi:hypothetical protein